MSICDKIYIFCACFIAVFFSDYISSKELHDDYCIEWKEHIERDKYVMGLETKVKDFYIFFVSEQKRIAEEAYLKTGIRYEW